MFSLFQIPVTLGSLEQVAGCASPLDMRFQPVDWSRFLAMFWKGMLVYCASVCFHHSKFAFFSDSVFIRVGFLCLFANELL